MWNSSSWSHKKSYRYTTTYDKTISTISQNKPLKSSSVRIVFFLMLLTCKVVQSIMVRACLQIVEGMTISMWNSSSSSHKKPYGYTTIDDMVHDINFYNITKQTSRVVIGKARLLPMLWTYKNRPQHQGPCSFRDRCRHDNISVKLILIVTQKNPLGIQPQMTWSKTSISTISQNKPLESSPVAGTSSSSCFGRIWAIQSIRVCARLQIVESMTISAIGRLRLWERINPPTFPTGANQPVQLFLWYKSLDIQQGTSVSIGSPKSTFHGYGLWLSY